MSSHAPGYPIHRGLLPSLLMAFNPYVTPPNLPKSGPVGGITRNGIFHWAPWAWVSEDIDVPVPDMVVVGLRGSGKSAAIKAMARTLSETHTEPGNPDSPLVSFWADDTRPEWDEIARSVTNYDGKPCKSLVVRNSRFNPFSGLSFDRQLVLTQRTFELVFGHYTPNYELVVASALEAMSRERGEASFPRMADILDDYANLQPALVRPNSTKASNVVRSEFEADAREVRNRISSLLRGVYGSAIGETTDVSVYNKLNQRAVIADYSGSTPEMAELMQMFFWQHLGRTVFKDIMIYEEGYQRLRSFSTALSIHDDMRHGRKNQTMRVTILHASDDTDTLGVSETLGKKILEHSPIWMIGRLKPQQAAAAQEILGYENWVRDLIPKLPNYTFVMIIGKLPPFTMKTVMSPMLKKLTYTSQAATARSGQQVD